MRVSKLTRPNRTPLGLDDITDLPRTKANFNRYRNRILNAKSGVAKSIITLGKELQVVKENAHFRPFYKSFTDYCDNEVDITWQTAYDYIKIYLFVEKNKDALSTEVAQTIGHRSLKLLAQKLSKIEEQQRKSILRKITEYEHYDKIKSRIESKISD